MKYGRTWGGLGMGFEVEWKTYKLSELMDVIGGGTPKTSIAEYWNGQIPWLSVKDFNSGNRKVYDTEKRITSLGLKSSSTKLLNKGDLIISARGTVGALAQLGSTMAFNQSCYGLRAKEKTSNDYLYYLVKYKIEDLKRNVHGSIFDTITRNTFDILEVKIPKDIREQDHIVNVLSSLDEKIETNNEINKRLEAIAQAIFKQWFIDFEFPNEEGKPYKSSGGKMVESELGMIPEGWEVFKVGEIVKITRGASPRPIKNYISDSGMPWVKISDATENSVKYLFKTKEFIIEAGIEKSRLVHPGTLILSNSATPGIPKIMLINACVHDGWLIFNDYKGITKEYIYYFLLREREGIVSLSNGSVFNNLKTDILKNYRIIVPSKEILEVANDMFIKINNEIKRRVYENNKLEEIRDTLLPKLMSGEIRVPLGEDETL